MIESAAIKKQQEADRIFMAQSVFVGGNINCIVSTLCTKCKNKWQQ